MLSRVHGNKQEVNHKCELYLSLILKVISKFWYRTCYVFFAVEIIIIFKKLTFNAYVIRLDFKTHLPFSCHEMCDQRNFSLKLEIQNSQLI